VAFILHTPIMQNLKRILLEGNRILAFRSAHARQLRYPRWRTIAQSALANRPLRKQMRFTLSTLHVDLDLLRLYLSNRKHLHRTEKGSRVFVVCGRNKDIQDDMFSFLRAIGLKPIEWTQAMSFSRSKTPFIGDVLEHAFDKAQAILIIFSGDDEAKLKARFLKKGDPAWENKLTPQPRPNVIFEAGMAFGRHPNRTIVVQVEKIRDISDWSGRHFVRLNGSAESRKDLVERLKRAQCKVDLSGTDWLNIRLVRKV
jgi:predicted nucleotide-binding protein